MQLSTVHQGGEVELECELVTERRNRACWAAGSSLVPGTAGLSPPAVALSGATRGSLTSIETFEFGPRALAADSRT